MKSLMRIAVCSMAILLLLTGIAVAQTVTGTLIGHVADKSGAIIPNAKVTAVNAATGAMREAVSNAEGYYQFDFLPIGGYDVTATSTGFRSVKKTGVMVELNKNTVSEFVLDVAAVAQEIEVRSGETQLVDTTTGEVKGTINEVQVAATPIAGRNFMSLLEQVPGFAPATFDGSSNNPTNSTGSYAAFNGQGTRSSTFQIDGVNNDDSSENQNRQGVNISTVKEVQVLTSAYAAEFGRAGGAVVLVQTKSGTNRLHGDLYDYIQNDIFNANDYFANQAGAKRPPVRRNNPGGTIGGPIFRNKLFFFASGERAEQVAKGAMSRFVWLPSDTPRPCNAGEHPGPKGPYCLEPSMHPNMQRDITFIKNVMSLWNTPELQGKSPNDPAACSALIASGRPNRCVRVDGIGIKYPDSDYTGKLDWNTSSKMQMNLRYQYSRQIRKTGRIIYGDNYGGNNNRQYNLGFTMTRVWSSHQTGEFRYGFGNRNTNQFVTDAVDHSIPIVPAGGIAMPILRFGGTTNTLVNPAASTDSSVTSNSGGTVIGTSTNVPIFRFQRDHQVVYNHTLVLDKHTFRMGIDQRFQALDDLASGTQRGYWSFGALGSSAAIAAGTAMTSWEAFLSGMNTGSFTLGYGQPYAENRFGETNLYAEDSWRLQQNLTLNVGLRWEGVRAPHEIKDRFSYGYGGDWNNIEPRLGIAWSPTAKSSFLSKITGAEKDDFVIRAGYGMYHDRIFQSVFSQSGLSLRYQPPNGFSFGGPPSICASNTGNYTVSLPAGNFPLNGGVFEMSDPTCGFQFTPGAASRSIPAACSLTAAGCNGVKVAGGQLLTNLLLPSKNVHLPYVQQWNLTIERKLPAKTALQVSYAGNRGIGLLYFNNINDPLFGAASPLATVDVGGGNFKPIVFDRVCKDYSDPICVTTTAAGAVNTASSGWFRSFSSLTDSTAALANKGIVIVNGVPHGYISGSTGRFAERRPDPTYSSNTGISNFAFTYYNALTIKLTKATSHGLTLSGFYNWSKTMDTGSEATVTNTDLARPIGSVNPQRSLRALSSFNQPQRMVISAVYQLPFMKNRSTPLAQVVGGWSLSSVLTFASGLPINVLAGYDANLDGSSNDAPVVVDRSIMGRSIDGGRPQNPCPSALSAGRCLDSIAQLQLNPAAFRPLQSNRTGDQFPVWPGQDFPTDYFVARRNSFVSQGQKNVDATVSKNFRIREAMGLEMRFELYNLFNRVYFGNSAGGGPAATVNSTVPLGRITGTSNPFNYVNSFRASSARMGQLALRFTW